MSTVGTCKFTHKAIVYFDFAHRVRAYLEHMDTRKVIMRLAINGMDVRG
jgi:hypothetical protein